MRIGAARFTVVLAGVLRERGAELVDGERVDVLELDLRTVIVERADLDSSLTARITVPLPTWFAADPVPAGTGGAAAQPLAEHCSRIVAHTNTAHAEQLRAAAARRAGRPADRIAGAALERVDRDGVWLVWIDDDGGHRARLRFPCQARTGEDIARALRAQLT